MKQSVLAPDMRPNATAERIIDAAKVCFEANGIQKTSIDDIASNSGLSRQTIYRYFTGKQAMIECIAIREMTAIGTVIRQRIPKATAFADKLTEALFVSVEEGSRNSYVQLILNDAAMMKRCFEPTGSLYGLQRQQWNAVLVSGRRTAELAEDLDDDEIVRWLAISQFMMLMAVDRFADWGATSRSFIRRLIVGPILSRPDGEAMPDPASATGLRGDIATIRGQLAKQERMLRDLVDRSSPSR